MIGIGMDLTDVRCWCEDDDDVAVGRGRVGGVGGGGGRHRGRTRPLPSKTTTKNVGEMGAGSSPCSRTTSCGRATRWKLIQKLGGSRLQRARMTNRGEPLPMDGAAATVASAQPDAKRTLSC